MTVIKQLQGITVLKCVSSLNIESACMYKLYLVHRTHERDGSVPIIDFVRPLATG